jgi:hypothetical protein
MVGSDVSVGAGVAAAVGATVGSVVAVGDDMGNVHADRPIIIKRMREKNFFMIQILPDCVYISFKHVLIILAGLWQQRPTMIQ